MKTTCEMSDDELFAEFHEIFNISRNDPDEYETKYRERMRDISKAMNERWLRPFPKPRKNADEMITLKEFCDEVYVQILEKKISLSLPIGDINVYHPSKANEISVEEYTDNEGNKKLAISS